MKDLQRILLRFNGIILLNMSGLAMGLAGVLFISLWISHELSYDRFHENAERIYRIESLMNYTENPMVWTGAPAPVGENIMKDLPGVEAVLRMKRTYTPILKSENEAYEADNMYYSTGEFFTLFSYKLIRGDKNSVLTDPNSIVISESRAKQIFGADDPEGKTLILNDKQLLTVTGVMADPPSNTHLKAEFLISFSSLDNPDLNSWGSFNFPTYIKLKEEVDAVSFNTKLADYLKTKNENTKARLFINPLTRIYLYKDPGFDSFVYPSDDRGPIRRVMLFGIIGLVLLLIACINFVNLATALGAERLKEIGVRKVSGASRRQIIFQLFGETLTQTVISLFMALILTVLLLPVFNRMTNLDVNLNYLLEPERLILILITTLLTAFLAGAYPSFILSSYNPVKIFRPGNESITSGLGLRKILVTTQFALSVLFVFSILVMNRQISYMQSTNLGFNKDQLMVIYSKDNTSKIDIMAEEISRLPGVRNVAVGGNVPVNMGTYDVIREWEGNTSDKEMKFYLMQVDDNLIDLLDIEIVEGSNLTDGAPRQEVLLNQAAVHMMGIKDPVGKTIMRRDIQYRIVGLVRDFHYQTLKDEVQPVFIYKPEHWAWKKVFVKLEAGTNFRLTDDISAIVKKNQPDFPVKYIFLDEEADRYYSEEKRLNKLINVATMLSIIISVIGLFSLTAFATRKKSKEMGIRKAHGASSTSLLIMLQIQFGRLVLIASFIALPLAFYIMSRWLESYAYHIKIKPIYFIITLLVAAAITSLTIMMHTLRTARLNPADTLRDE